MTTTSGKAENPIATKTDVNGIRVNSFSSGGTECVTVQDVRKNEFLDVKNRVKNIPITSITNSSSFGINQDIGIGLTRNGETYLSQAVTNENVGTYTPTTGTQYVMVNAYCNSINHNSVSTITYTSTWPTGSTAKHHALWEKTFTDIPEGKIITLKVNTSIEAVQTDSQNNFSSASVIKFQNVTWHIGYIVTDFDDNVIWSQAPYNPYVDNISENITFSSPTSRIKLYCIVASVHGNFYMIDNSDYYTGFRLSVSDSIEYNDSYYDSILKLAQYQDIYHVPKSQFTIYYGIWNNKKSNAKLDTIKVQIKKSTDTTWTDIGSKSIGTIDTSTTGSITCTLPAGFNPSVAYDFRLTCGQTTYNQNWKYRWGNITSLTSSAYLWGSYSSSAKTGVCGPISLNGSDQNAVLANYNNSSIPGLHYGRSSTYAALFQIS